MDIFRWGLVYAIWTASRIPLLRHIATASTCSILRKSSLFDREFYLRQNPDVAKSLYDPLKHYVVAGDREGRQPNPIFDPIHYRRQSGIRFRGVNSLLHYQVYGHSKNVWVSEWFDNGFYLRSNSDVTEARINPLEHFLSWGGNEGRSPFLEFDCAFYLSANPDVVKSNINPLVHYIQYGQAEQRLCNPLGTTRRTQSSGPTLADIARQEALIEVDQLRDVKPAKAATAEIDVVIPVYDDRKLTLRCIASALKARNTVACRIIAIDDCGPNKDLTQDLKRLSDLGLIEVLRNDKNRGFVKTANRGLQYSQNDVVLLNSDTEVYDGWLDKLHRTAYRSSSVASVTPLSNNATICSYPLTIEENNYPLEIEGAQIDKICTAVNPELTVEAPTGHGFCMYMTRAAITRVGLLDEETFGRGYGEENDWCQRAIGLGYKNLLLADTFVTHFGGASFGNEKDSRVLAAIDQLQRLYPSYNAQVQEFIKIDPLKEARQAMDWARLSAGVKKKNILFLCHDRGGGAIKHLQDDARAMQEQGYGVFFLKPVGTNSATVRLSGDKCVDLPNIKPFDLFELEPLAEALRKLSISQLSSHGLIDFVANAPTQVSKLAELLGVPLSVDIHDYKVICPRINLARNNGRYCYEPEAARCNECLSHEGNGFDCTDIVAWREQHHKVLKTCKEIFVPDRDVKQRLHRYFPDVKFHVQPHDQIKFSANDFPRSENENLRVVVIGAISRIKGFETLLACARDAKARRLPIEFVIMGYSMDDAQLLTEGVQITGKYEDSKAQETLLKLNPHVVFIPSLWPETYSYTLSIALRAGIKIFAFDIGAIANRLREQGCSSGIMPLDYADTPTKVNNKMLEESLSNKRNPQAAHQVTA